MSTPILDITTTCRHFIQHGTPPASMTHLRLQVGAELSTTAEISLRGSACEQMQSGKRYRVLIEEITTE